MKKILASILLLSLVLLTAACGNPENYVHAEEMEKPAEPSSAEDRESAVPSDASDARTAGNEKAAETSAEELPPESSEEITEPEPGSEAEKYSMDYQAKVWQLGGSEYLKEFSEKMIGKGIYLFCSAEEFSEYFRLTADHGDLYPDFADAVNKDEEYLKCLYGEDYFKNNVLICFTDLTAGLCKSIEVSALETDGTDLTVSVLEYYGQIVSAAVGNYLVCVELSRNSLKAFQTAGVVISSVLNEDMQYAEYMRLGKTEYFSSVMVK